jgi:hypothetical protein
MRLRHVFMTIVLFVPLLAACGREGTPEILDVTATDYGFEGVHESIKGGRIDLTFRNEGEVEHEFALVELNGHSVEEFGKVAEGFMEGGPIPEWLTNLTVPADIPAGETRETSFNLPEGEYLLFCALTGAPGGKDGKPHFELGMRQDVTVEGDNGVDLNATAGEFVAKDFTFEAPETLLAGNNTYSFTNEGPKEWHFMSLNEYPEGTSVAEAEAAFGTLITLEEGKAPPKDLVMPEEFVDTGVFSPGLGQTFEADFKPGRTYLAACFIQDKTGGPPHAIGHKMYKAFTVDET